MNLHEDVEFVRELAPHVMNLELLFRLVAYVCHGCSLVFAEEVRPAHYRVFVGGVGGDVADRWPTELRSFCPSWLLINVERAP